MRAEESNRGISNGAALGIRVVALVAWTVGCSKANPNDSGNPIDLSDPGAFCDAYSKAMAIHQLACLGGTLTVGGQPLCLVAPNTEVSSGSVSYDPVAASACLDELPVLPCWQNDGSDCSKVFTGTIPEGGACFPAFGIEECVSGTRCVVSVQCPGVCTGYAQLGETCDMDDTSSTFCGAGLTCAPGSNPQCVAAPVPTPGLGTPCSWFYDCQMSNVTLACEGPNGPINTSTPDGTCQPPRDDGPCLSPSDCRSYVCVGGNCMPPKVTGDACTPGMRECGPGTYCGSASACALLPTVGQSCAGSAAEGPGCLDVPCDPVSLTCVPFGKLGDSCQTVPCSIELSCDSTSLTCVPSCIRGSACGAPGQVCCDGQTGPGPTGLCNSGSACVNALCAS
jgi:hypothetical protein